MNKKMNKYLVGPAVWAALAMGVGTEKVAAYSAVVSYSGEVYVNLVTVPNGNATASASVTYNDSCVSSSYQSFIGSAMTVTSGAGPTQIAMASSTTAGNNFQFGASGVSLNVTCSIGGGASNTFNVPLVFNTYPCDKIDSCGVKTGDLLQTLGIGTSSLPGSYTNCPTWGSTTTTPASGQTLGAVNTQQESLNFFVPTSSVTRGYGNSQIPALAVDIQLFYAGFNVPSGIQPIAPFLIQVACGPLSSFGN